MATVSTPIGKLFQDAGFEQGVSLNLSRIVAQVAAINLMDRIDAAFDLSPSNCSHGGQEARVMIKPREAEWTDGRTQHLRANLPGTQSNEEQRQESRDQLAAIVIALQGLIEEEISA